MPFALFILILIGLAGVLLIVLGWRGRRLDDHPWCRRCRYDLVAATEDAKTCPECGANLDAPRAVAIGRRRRRPIVLAIGIALALAALGAGSSLGWMAAKGYGIDRLTPSWVLHRQARSSVVRRSDAALVELTRRLSANELRDVRIDAIVADALDLQADTSRPWRTGWGDFVDVVAGMGKLDTAAQRRYAERVVDVVGHHRPSVRQGQPLPLAYEFVLARHGSGTALEANVQVESALLGDKRLYIGPRGAPLSFTSSRGPWAWRPGHLHPAPWRLTFDHLDDRNPYRRSGTVELEPGTYELHVTWRVRVSSSVTEQPLAEFTRDDTGTVRVLPADAPLPPLEVDGEPIGTIVPVTRPAMATTFTGTAAYGSITLASPDRDCAIDIYWRSGTEEFYVGAEILRAGPGQTSVSFGRRVTDPHDIAMLKRWPRRIDIVIRPSRAGAEMSTDLFTVPTFDDVVLRDVWLDHGQQGKP